MDNNTLTVLTVLIVICIVSIFFLLFINLKFRHKIYSLKQDNEQLRKELIAIIQRQL